MQPLCEACGRLDGCRWNGGWNVTSIRCPLCDDRISGEEVVLGSLLADHLREAHQVRPSSARPFPTHQSPAPEGGRLHQAEIRREEQAWAPPAGAPVPQRPERLGDWVRKAVGTDQPPTEGGEWTSGEGYPTMMDRERTGGRSPSPAGKVSKEVMDSIICPLCGEVIDGWGEDALTSRFREHASSAHRLTRLVHE